MYPSSLPRLALRSEAARQIVLKKYRNGCCHQLHGQVDVRVGHAICRGSFKQDKPLKVLPIGVETEVVHELSLHNTANILLAQPKLFPQQGMALQRHMQMKQNHIRARTTWSRDRIITMQEVSGAMSTVDIDPAITLRR